MPSTAYTGVGVLDHNLDDIGDYIVVSDGRIERIGRGRPPSWSTARKVDGYIHPPFIDAHLHITWLGLALEGADLRGTKRPEDIARRLSKTRGPIAYGRGWDQEDFEDPGRLPDKNLLDRYIPDRPAVAVRVCGHVAIANTAALSLARPWEKYPGFVEREKGVLLEDAVYYTLERLLEEVDPTSLVSRAIEALLDVGIAGASSMACPRTEAEALQRLKPRFRVACYPKPEDLEHFYQNHRSLLAGVKMFSDGTLGARTAYLRAPYSDMPDTRGTLLLDSKQIEAVSRRALEKGLRVAVHAIGDAALDEVLDAHERLDPGPQARIEHASIAWDNQLQKISSLGVWVVVQPRFRVSDWWIDKRLGDRAALAYRFRSMILHGVNLAISTDAPVEPYDPYETIQAAMGRCRTVTCRSEESLSKREVFRLYTRSAAEASGGTVSGLARMEPGAPAVLAWSSTPPLGDDWRGVGGLILEG